jgi:CTP:molybdopterin cytidylyltransferase MocA
MLAGSLTVLPAGDERLIILARAHGSRVIENDAPALGLSRSLRLGLAALAESAAGAALILLGDEPRVRLETIARVIDAWHRKPGGIVRPRYADQPGAPGHPLLIDRAGWRLARALEGDSGLGPILRSHPELVTTVDLEGSNPDVDTTDDLYSLEEPH